MSSLDLESNFNPPALNNQSNNLNSSALSSQSDYLDPVPKTSIESLTLQRKIGIGLWIFLFLLIVAGIAIFLIFRQPGTVQTPSVTPKSCLGVLPEVPDVTDMNRFTPCCDIEGANNGRFYDIMNNWTVVILPEQEIPSANQVCIDFCAQVSLPTDCITSDSTHQECLTILTPQDCTDPVLPAAKLGDTPYYAVGKGKVSCYPCSQ